MVKTMVERIYRWGREDEKTKIGKEIRRNNSGKGQVETGWVSVFAAVTFVVVDLQ